MPKNESTHLDAESVVLYGKASDDNLGSYPLTIDKTTLAIAMIDYPHKEIHSGSHFSYDNYLSIAKAETKYVLLITPNTTKYSHVFVDVDVTAGELEYSFIENSTITLNGTQVTIYNNHRVLTTTSGTVVFINPTVTEGTTVLRKKYFGATKSNGGGASRNELEFVLKPNTNYLLKLSEQNIAACKANFIIQWYEHTNKI